MMATLVLHELSQRFTDQVLPSEVDALFSRIKTAGKVYSTTPKI